MVYKEEKYEVLEGELGAKYKGTHYNIVEKLASQGETDQNVNDPVNIVTGNYYASSIDIIIEDHLPITIERSYNSLSDEVGLLGKGWRWNFETSLEENTQDDKVTVKYPDGHAITYTKESDKGAYTVPNAVKEDLTKQSNGSFELMFKNKLIYTYSALGKLISIRDKNNIKIELIYDAHGILTKIKSTHQSLDVQITNGKLERVEDDKGRYVAFTYQGNNLTKVQTKKRNKKRMSIVSMVLHHQPTIMVILT